ncbi:HpcH/HpaI aldolase/citrate lyase family protein [Granulosicoccus sp. 3-233]|uniref:HpcH/HpaI aldolase/citrate lyase family protein n=1 Tax=Granulosicoccus sp. 3-233 TaxID=3417969 RepID=UPI003D3495C5
MSQVDCRSALYMPASVEKVLAKGPVCAADAVILDLEDAVAPESKGRAREQAVTALTQYDYGYRLRGLRINAADTAWHQEDVAAVARSRPDAVVLPKVESVDDIRRLSQALDALPDTADIAVWAMMESPLAILNAQTIAQSAGEYPRLSMLIVGSNDLVREAGMPMGQDRTLLVPWLMTLVAAARAYGLQILDGVFNDFSDNAGLERECRQGVAMGMDGKTLIHPSQIVTCNKLFAPSDEALDEAQAIVDAFRDPHNAEAGVVQVRGKMVERLHLDMALQLLARSERLAGRG